MKDYRYWLQFLSDEERQNWFEEVNLNNLSSYETFGDFIGCSFIWDGTKQGHHYWSWIAARRVKEVGPKFKLLKHELY